MKIKPVIIAVVIILLFLCVLSYISAPATDSFDISSINPLFILSGIVFLFSFGFGFPVFISIGLVVLTLIAAIVLLAKLIQKLQPGNKQ